MFFGKRFIVAIVLTAAFPFHATALNWNGWADTVDDGGHAKTEPTENNLEKLKDNIDIVNDDLGKAKEQQREWNEKQDKVNEEQNERYSEQQDWNAGQEKLNEKQKEINHKQSQLNEQFKNDISHLKTRIDGVENKMKRGFASQAALSGLFQPYGLGKANLSMAFGGYESHTAIAIGSGYRFSENIAIKTGVSTNTEDFKGLSYTTGINLEW